MIQCCGIYMHTAHKHTHTWQYRQCQELQVCTISYVIVLLMITCSQIGRGSWHHSCSKHGKLKELSMNLYLWSMLCAGVSTLHDNLLRLLNVLSPYCVGGKWGFWEVRCLAQGHTSNVSWDSNLGCKAYVISIAKAQSSYSTLSSFLPSWGPPFSPSTSWT